MNKKQKFFVFSICLFLFVLGIFILTKARGMEAFSLGIILLLPFIALIAIKLFLKEDKEEDD